MALFSVNSGQRGLTGKTVCPLESLTGMSFAVRFMTAVEKYALTIGACIASGKHAGFPVIPATIVTVAIRQAGSMARAFPAWNRRSGSALALCSGYAKVFGCLEADAEDGADLEGRLAEADKRML